METLYGFSLAQWREHLATVGTGDGPVTATCPRGEPRMGGYPSPLDFIRTTPSNGACVRAQPIVMPTQNPARRLCLTRVDASCALQAAVEASRPKLEARGLRVTVTTPWRPVCVLADAQELNTVLQELLTQALERTLPGGQLEFRAGEAGEQAELVVSATSPGAAPLPEALAGVRQLVELCGGSLETRGGGRELVVLLPLALEEMDPVPAVRSAAVARAPLQSRKVLVVDDHPDAAESLASVVEEFGHQAWVAHDGPEALRLAVECQPDLVFLDIGLPGMDGYSVARELVRLCANPPSLVALTGRSYDRDKGESRDAGFYRHLVKPASLESITAILADLAPPKEGGVH